MDELSLIISRDESISKLPNRFIKIILSEDETLVNPLINLYKLSSKTNLSFGKHTIFINPQNGFAEIDKLKIFVCNHYVAHVYINHDNVLKEMYPDKVTLEEKLGITGHHPKY